VAAPSPELAALLARVRPGAPIALGDRTLVPLVLRRRGREDVLDVELLDEGIAAGWTWIFPGSTPRTARVVHRGPRPLLVVDGEPVLGARSMGVFDGSAIVPSGATVEVPVTPIDGGNSLARIVPLPTQIGIAVVRGEAVVALHVFGAPGIFVRGWRKVLRGIAMPLPGSSCAHDAVAIVDRALRTLGALPVERRSSPGLGESLRASTHGWVAGALVHERRLFHAAATGAVQA
jgi:hypothetical protein